MADVSRTYDIEHEDYEGIAERLHLTLADDGLIIDLYRTADYGPDDLMDSTWLTIDELHAYLRPVATHQSISAPSEEHSA